MLRLNQLRGFRVYSPELGSTFTGSLNISGSVTIPSGSGFFSGSGEGLFNIPADAIEGLDQSRILSGSVTASVNPDDGFVVRSIDSGSTFFGEVNFQNDVSASKITVTDEIFSPRITSSFVGSYQGENVGIDVPDDLDILIFDADANKFRPVSQFGDTAIFPFSDVTQVTFQHNFALDYPVVQIYETGSNGQIIPQSIESINSSSIRVTFSGLTSGQAVIGTGGRLAGFVEGSNVVGLFFLHHMQILQKTLILHQI